jgi:hypothetical protein
MYLDIYYAVENQDQFGTEVKTWVFNRSILGYAEILGAVNRDALKNNQFFEYESKLIGRSKEDATLALNSDRYPISSILITNIRDAETNIHFYKEPFGDRRNLSTLFEIMAVEPYVNPWNEIEYYKILFNRSDQQILLPGETNAST